MKIRGRAPDEIYVLVGKRVWKGDELIGVLDETDEETDAAPQ